MSEVKSTDTVSFHITSGAGTLLHEQLGYAQAVRIGDRIELSGQGGWDDDLVIPERLEDEIVAAFDNIERVLAAAGAGWPDVVHVNSYHKVTPDQAAIDPAHNEIIAREFRNRLGATTPVWTQTGTPGLALATMNIEIRVTAIVGHGAR